MTEERKRFLEILRRKSYEKRKVILSSGRESDFYVDCKQATLDAEGAVLVGRLFCDMLERDRMPEAVGGITLGADPIVTAIAITSALRGNPIPAFIIRKEPKKHGMAQWLEGTKNLSPGMKVAIVEDVVTTGASTMRAIDRAQGFGLVVSRVLCIVDRKEGGAEALGDKGFRLEAMFRREEIEGV